MPFLAGDGPCGDLLKDLAHSEDLSDDEVTFHGAMNQDALRSLFETAEIFVLPSFAEGIPVALMEAMAMEIPCISTFIAGIPELIDSGVDGILVPQSDPIALDDAIERLWNNHVFRREPGRAGRRKVLAKYDLRTNIPRLNNFSEEYPPPN